MDTFGIIAFTFSLSALAFAIKNHERINTLEKKLKDFDINPGHFSSESTPGKAKKNEDD
jgi:hypothetical protein